MSDTKHPAEALAESLMMPLPVCGPDAHLAAVMLRRIPALEAEIARLKEHAVTLANTAMYVEREACAHIAETHGTRDPADGPAIAAAIRARKEAP